MRGISRRTGATARQIRHWERVGLLGQVVRSDGGQRLYEGAQVRTVGDITELRQQGFSLAEIRALLWTDATAAELEELAALEEQEACGAAGRARRLRAAASERREPAV